jgi:teichuronic acid biosynthesis glycosyltransferase TuaG
MPIPSVSIVMPSHQTASWIGEAIASVRAQTFRDWELLIVDDASTDNSLEEIAKAAGDDLGGRIKLEISAHRLGPAEARNRSIRAARARYIAFLDSDDRWRPAKLERQLRFMEKNKAALAFASYALMNEDGKALGIRAIAPPSVSYRSLLSCNVIGCLTACYDTQQVGKMVMPDIARRQDHGLWLSIVKTGVQAHGQDEVLADYRVRGVSVSSNKLQAARWQWRLYRDIERLGFFSSMVVFARYACAGLARSRFVRHSEPGPAADKI